MKKRKKRTLVSKNKQTKIRRKGYSFSFIFLLLLIISLVFTLSYFILRGNSESTVNQVKPGTESNIGSSEFRKQGDLSIMDPHGSIRAKFDIELADTPAKRARGLMHRFEMKKNQGMFFVFPESIIQSFWMKDTFIPLDIIFIDEDLVVVEFFENAQPMSTEPIISYEPAMYVLEINAGLIDKKNISVGDVVSLD